MMTTTPEHVSAFAKAIAERHAHRKVHAFPIDGFFGLGDKPIPQVGIRVPTKREEVAALDQAYKLVKDLCSQEEARSDADVLADLKAACIAFQACRDIDNPKYPAFPGPEWMYKHLSGDQIGALLNLMNQVRVAESPAPVDVSDAQVEAWVTVCAAAAGSEIPSHQLAGVPREYLVYLVTAMSEKLVTERTHALVLAKAAAESKG